MQSSYPWVVGVLLLVLSLAACGDTRRGGASDSSVNLDSALTDLGTDSVDASDSDGGAFDGGEGTDTGVVPSDSGSADSSTIDGGPGGLLPRSGDLVFVEIQGNPVRATDEQGEYLEILNVSGRVIDLTGVTITHISFVGGEPDVSADRHTVAMTLFMEPGERVLLASSDGGFFGSAEADYVYSDILISNAETETTRFRLMVPGWDRTEPPSALDVVDEVIVESRLFGNAVRGQAWQFDPARGTPTAASNDDASNWCTTSATAALEYRGSNFGTPSAPNVCD
ncbi:MAG: hypothetical protein ACI9KE_003010 [Polyangiales bacterium]|jgi:hypothetical protein